MAPAALNTEAIALKLVRQARGLLNSGHAERAKPLLLKAWSSARHSQKVLTTVSGTLIDMGEDDAAYTVLQEAAALQGESEALYQIVGEMALRMQIASIAEKAYNKACELNPAEPSHYVNLAESLKLNYKQDEAIGLLQSSLPHFPDHAGMWNALAQLTLNHLRDKDNALIFQQEAVRHAPQSAQYLHNLALMHNSAPAADPYFQAALALEPQNAQINMSYALYLMGRGDLVRAWKHYEYRLDPGLGYTRAAKFTHGIKPWRGQKLGGKSILVCAEQGIGDEVMFAVFLNAMIERAGQVYIGCDPRLVSLYERSFPRAIIAAYEDKRNFRYRERSFPAIENKSGKTRMDYAVAIGSLPLYLAPDFTSYRSFQGGFAVPDPGLVQKLATHMPSAGRQKIAISWRSGNLAQERSHAYGTADLYRQLASVYDADFYVLQYTYTPEEKAHLADLPNVHFFADIDLKQDIEANVALFSMMDVSVGPPTATQMFAMAAGCPVFMINNGLPWSMLGSTRMEPTYAAGSRYVHVKETAALVADLKKFLAALKT